MKDNLHIIKVLSNTIRRTFTANRETLSSKDFKVMIRDFFTVSLGVHLKPVKGIDERIRTVIKLVHQDDIASLSLKKLARCFNTLYSHREQPLFRRIKSTRRKQLSLRICRYLSTRN